MRGDHPNSWKIVPRMLVQMKIFHVGSHQFREVLRELLREFWVSYCTSRGMPFREWNFVFREWNFEFRELLREYPGTLPELREWPFCSESVFPKIGVVPRLLNYIPVKTDWFFHKKGVTLIADGARCYSRAWFLETGGLPFAQMAPQTEKSNFQMNFACHGRCRYGQNCIGNTIFIADAETDVLAA